MEKIKLWVNNELQEVSGVDPHASLLQWLRQDQGLCGTKEGCAEGDCGACTVLVSDPHAPEGQPTVKAVNSCIRLLPTLHGKSVTTVEGLGQPEKMHPVQQAMVDCHASQCGFCTPGFVMSLAALHAQRTNATREEICNALSGNLCRCTGYRPIVDAAQQMFKLAQGGYGACLPLDSITPIEHYEANGRHFFWPKSPEALSELLMAHPDAWILAGGTDVGLWINKALQTKDKIIYIGDMPALSKVEVTAKQIRIGAAVTLDRAFDSLNQFYPQAKEVWERFASVPVRASGTLVGNIANGSPIGDSMPVLIAIGATVELQSAQGSRTLPLEALYVDYKKQSRQPGEWVASVNVPLPKANLKLAAYKLSKRYDQDISAVLCAVAIEVDSTSIIREARVCYGGMAGTPKRASYVEAALVDQALSQSTFANAALEIAQDFRPLSDMRASAEYRAQAASNLLLRFFYEHSPSSGIQTRLSVGVPS